MGITTFDTFKNIRPDQGVVLSGTQLKNLQRVLLSILKDVADVCDELGIRYYLCGGTLLGAIREKGFIPWDDDIDIAMPRADYERFVPAFREKLGSKYWVHTPEETEGYELLFPRVRLKGTTVKTRDDFRNDEAGAFVDIFIIENTYDSGFKRTVHGILSMGAGFLLSCRKFYRNRKELCALVRGNQRALTKCRMKIAIGFCIGYIRLDALRRFANRCNAMCKDNGSGLTTICTGRKYFFGEIYPRTMFAGNRQSEFEEMMFSVPSGAEKYLEQLYGNWRVRPEDSKKEEHIYLEFDLGQAADMGTKFERNVFPESVPNDICVTQLHGAVNSEFPNEGKFVSPLDNDSDCRDRKLRIAMCGLIKSSNLGELFIARSLEYLIRKECKEAGISKEIEFIEVDLLGRIRADFKGQKPLENRLENYYRYRSIGIFMDALHSSLRIVAKKLKKRKLSNAIHRFRHFIWTHGINCGKRLNAYFEEMMTEVSMIVVDGAGLLEYEHNEYQERLNLLSRYAEMNHLPVVYNAIGKAGKVESGDFRCKILKDALQAECIKYVSARDSQETVQMCAGDRHQVKLLADAAFWMKETYGMSKRPVSKKIGIGLVRGSALLTYGIQFTEDQWISLFSNIADELQKRGYEFEFFTNGLPEDVALGERILESKGLSDRYLVKGPTDDIILYETIAAYRGLITCRMHSAIAATTLGIPTVILSWNDKVNKMMSQIGYPERVINMEDFNAGFIVDRFEEALCEGVADEKIARMKDLAAQSVRDYIPIIQELVSTGKEQETEPVIQNSGCTVAGDNKC